MKYFASLFLILSFCCKSLHAQVQDFNTWSSIAITKQFSKKLDLGIQQMLRLNENSTRFDQTYTDVGLNYEMNKKFSVAANYRLIIKADVVKNRIYTDLVYSEKWNRWKANARMRIENNFIPQQADEIYLRPKLTFSNKLNKRFEPLISGELFFSLFYYKGDNLVQYRLSGGTEYHFDRKNTLRLYYTYEREMNVNAAGIKHILGVSYNFKIEKK
ncbi:MAG: DUF2490 domain-containing protein [Chitinophagales bacterium]|nr:DUF2490 domain-containing protein [Chitinophagales bacterium]